MVNKRKCSAPRQWGLPEPSHSFVEQQETGEEDGCLQDQAGRKRVCRPAFTCVRVTNHHGEEHVPQIQPFFQLLFTSPHSTRPDRLDVSTTSSSAEARADMIFKSATSDPDEGRSVEVQLGAPSSACCQALLRLLKSERLHLRMRPASPPKELNQGVVLCTSSSGPSPYAVVLPVGPSSQSSPLSPDHACLGGAAGCCIQGGGPSNSQEPWLPTRLMSHAAHKLCMAQSEAATAAAAAAPAAAAAAAAPAPVEATKGARLWALEIGLPGEGCVLHGAARQVGGGGEQAGGAEEGGGHLEDTAKHAHMLTTLSWLLPHTTVGRAGQSSAATAAAAAAAVEEAPRLEAAQIYAAIKPSGDEAAFAHDPPELKPRLRGYQRRAVAWMLGREQAGQEGQLGQAGQAAPGQRSTDTCAAPAHPPVHPLFRCVQCLDAPPFYVNPYTGLIVKQAPLLLSTKDAAVRGGILAEEMGLGKTVELVATILSHRFKPSQERPLAARAGSQQQGARPCVERIECLCGFASSSLAADGGHRGTWVRCDACLAWMHGDCVGWKKSLAEDVPWVCQPCQRAMASQQVTEPCGATLIVCPAPILSQWWNEIHKHCHTADLRVVLYHGQMQPGMSTAALSNALWAAPFGASAATPAGGRAGNAAQGQQRVGQGAAGQARRWGSQRKGPAGALAATRELPAGARAQPPLLVTAADLASADIVLTTYDVLKYDLKRQPGLEEVPQKQLRKPKRYMVLPTPLTRLKWWRVVLDEAQMVESTTAQATEMALKLETVHRWCVSGTPINRDLDDLYGLVTFLGIKPWNNFMWWTMHLSHPARTGCAEARRRLLALLCPAYGGILWRSSKHDVAHELDIPPQYAHTTILSLSAVERHFYTRQHHECASKAKLVLPPALLTEAAAAGMAAAPAAPLQTPTKRKLGTHWAEDEEEESTKLDRPLTEKESKQLMKPLLRLRQACCHPQVGCGGIKSVTHQKAPMTMDEIHQVLVAKAKVEAEEAQRALVASLNGQAALRLLGVEGYQLTPQQQQDAAAALYMEAMQTMDANKQDIDTDPLQRLHTLHNLAALLRQAACAACPHWHQMALKDDHGTSGGQAVGGQGTNDEPPSRALGTDHGSQQALLPVLVNRQEALEAEAQAIRTKYLQQRSLRLIAQQHDFDKTLDVATGSGAAASSRRGPQAQGKGGTGEVPSSSASWYLDAIDMLCSAGKQQDVKEYVKNKLLEKDSYRQQTTVNASSMANRFKSLSGLKIILTEALDSIERSRAAAMAKLQELTRACSKPSPEFVQQAGSCHRCRSELGVRGMLCEHCKLDELQVNWEVNLFALYSRALTAGGQVSADEAARRAHASTLQRVGQGGLGEEEAQDAGGVADGDSRRGEKVTVTETSIVWHPSEAEQVLNMLAAQFRSHLGAGGRKVPSGSPATAAHVEAVVQCAKEHLGQLEAQRKLFALARALSLSQRMLLYAHDELDMAVMRLRLRAEGEHVQPYEQHFKLHPAELPVKQRELSDDKAVAEADLKRTLGTLRYLRSLRDKHSKAAGQGQGPVGPSGLAAEARAAGQAAQADGAKQSPTQEVGPPAAAAKEPAAAAQAPNAAAAGTQSTAAVAAAAGQGEGASEGAAPAPGPAPAPAAGGAGACDVEGGGAEPPTCLMCPICHESIGAQCSVLPCGHQVCCDCCSLLVSRVPAQVLPAHRRIHCPTCRAMTIVDDIAHVDAALEPMGGPAAAAPSIHTTSVVLSGPAGAASHLPLSAPLAAAIATHPSAPLAHPTPGPLQPAAAAGGAPGSVAAMPWVDLEQETRVEGSYSTKVEAIVRRLAAIIAHDLTAKVVVFSSWQDMLEILSHALAENLLPFAYPRTRKAFHAALAAFKGRAGQQRGQGQEQEQEQEGGVEEEEEEGGGGGEAAALPESGAEGQGGLAGVGPEEGVEEDGHEGVLGTGADAPCQHQQQQQQRQQQRQRQKRAGKAATQAPARKRCRMLPRRPQALHAAPRILLLNTTQGSAGLNITEAQHVLFAEPLLDAAAEAQAIGRVHRIGQTRETHVHRFIMRDTIEESVHALAAQRRAQASTDPSALATARTGVQEALSVRDVALLLDRSTCGSGGDHAYGHQARAPQGTRQQQQRQQQQQQQGCVAALASSESGIGAPAPAAAHRAAQSDPRAAAAAAAEARWAAASLQQAASADAGV